MFRSLKKYIQQRVIVSDVPSVFFSHLSVQLLLVFVFYFFSLSFYFFLTKSFTFLDDQFFNIRLVEIFREQGLTVFQHFDWFAYGGSDPWISNLLFYASLLPFTLITPLEVGIKMYAVSMMALTFTSVYFFFVSMRLRNAFMSTLFIAALLFTPGLFKQMLVARAMVILPAMLLFELALLVRRKYTGVILLTCTYFFWHTATFFLPLVIASVYYIFVSQKEGHLADWRIFWAPIFGMIGGFLVSILCIPGFFQAFTRTFEAVFGIIFQSGILNHIPIQEGSEVYPVNFFTMYGGMSVFMISVTFFSVQALGDYFRGYFQKPIKNIPQSSLYFTFFFLTLLFLLGTLMTARLLDFFVLFGSVFIVFSLDIFLERFSWRSNRIIVTGVILVISLSFVSNGLLLADLIVSGNYYRLIEGPAEWCMEHTRPKEIIFIPTMNSFPTFFFFNKGYNRVIIGIEPRRMFDFDQRRYWLWNNVSNLGVMCDHYQCLDEIADFDKAIRIDAQAGYAEFGLKVARMIHENFNTRYILVSKDFEKLSALLQNSPSFEKAYDDPKQSFYSIYRIKDEAL